MLNQFKNSIKSLLGIKNPDLLEILKKKGLQYLSKLFAEGACRI